MKEKILKIAAEIDSRFQIKFSEMGKIILFKARYDTAAGIWRYDHCHDIKSEWMSFTPRCEWFDFKSALCYAADLENSIEL